MHSDNYLDKVLNPEYISRCVKENIFVDPDLYLFFKG